MLRTAMAMAGSVDAIIMHRAANIPFLLKSIDTFKKVSILALANPMLLSS